MYELPSYEDMAEYSYLIHPFKFANVKTVGWLNAKSNFKTGDLQEAVLKKLKNIARRDGVFQPLVDPSRHSPYCEICGLVKLDHAHGEWIPSAELWIPHGDIIFSSPTTILHYIEKHHYLPPDDFIEAVNGVDISKPFNAEKVYRDYLVTSGWVERIR